MGRLIKTAETKVRSTVPWVVDNEYSQCITLLYVTDGHFHYRINLFVRQPKVQRVQVCSHILYTRCASEWQHSNLHCKSKHHLLRCLAELLGNVGDNRVRNHVGIAGQQPKALIENLVLRAKFTDFFVPAILCLTPTWTSKWKSGFNAIQFK